LGHLFFVFGGSSLDLLKVRFGSLGSHLFLGLALLGTNADLVEVVLEGPFSLLLTSLPGLLGLVDFGGGFLGLLDLLVNHF